MSDAAWPFVWSGLIFATIAGILAILMPFFVFKIRNEIVSINEKFNILLEIMQKNQSVQEKRDNKVHEIMKKVSSPNKPA